MSNKNNKLLGKKISDKKPEPGDPDYEPPPPVFCPKCDILLDDD